MITHEILLKEYEKQLNNKNLGSKPIRMFYENGNFNQDNWNGGDSNLIRSYLDKLDDNTYYYLATYHIEPKKTPCYHPNNGKVGFMPMPYPVFIPPKKCCKPPTRDEVNEF